MKKIFLFLFLIYSYSFSATQITASYYSYRMSQCYASYTYYDSSKYSGFYIIGDSDSWVLYNDYTRISCVSESYYNKYKPTKNIDIKRGSDDLCNGIDIRFNTKTQIVEVCNRTEGSYIPLENAVSYNELTGELTCRDTYTENSISNLNITTNPTTGLTQSYYYNTYSCINDGAREPTNPNNGSTGGTDSGSGSTGGTDSGSGSTGGTDSGSGSTGGTDSGTGSTGGTDSGTGSTGGTDSGSGSTGGTDSGSGSTGGTDSGSGSTGGTDSGSGSTGGTDSGTGSTGGTDSGTGSTGGTDETLIGLLQDLNNNGNTNTNKITNSISSNSNTLNSTLKDSLQDSEGKPFLQTISDFTKSLTAPTTNEQKNILSDDINNSVSNSLNSTFSKYSNVLGFGSSYGNRPQNITLTLFNQEYILINFALLEPFVSIIRALFLSLAYLYGFMNLLRGEK